MIEAGTHAERHWMSQKQLTHLYKMVLDLEANLTVAEHTIHRLALVDIKNLIHKLQQEKENER